MNLRFLPLVLALTTVAPLAVQAQQMPKPNEMPAPDLRVTPKDLEVGKVLKGTITANDLAKVTKEFGLLKCRDFKVTLQQSNPSNVIVQVPGEPQKSKFPDSYAPVTVQATGNHLGLGCSFALTIPDTAKGQQGYLWVASPHQSLVVSPKGWQNPMPVPYMIGTWRNFVVNVIDIK
ncbi:hypothetical protein LQF76_03650 [Gloeomargaritales cyanobacterium VI4D9]|nr:hypothetical protein LQF76_03650 [Gloeomargaritales cyanobacterium VI4D9]